MCFFILSARAASRRALERVGWACMVLAKSSLLAENSMANTASAIISEAWFPIMCTPSIASVSACAMILTIPSVWPMAWARAVAFNGKVPILMASPIALKACSVWPTQAISGAVKMTLGRMS